MYKLASYFTGVCISLIFISTNASAQKFAKTDDGIIVYPNQNYSGNGQAVKLQVVNDRIIRVAASATNNFRNESLMILFSLRPMRLSPPSLYGLGQHQDGIVNYRNNQVYLFQNNTEVAVPLLVSSKNY